MKKLSLILFLALTYQFSSGQVFRMDSLPKQGILLDKGWKWHAGDNPDFARASFDDSKWESIDPTKDIFDLPQLPKTGEIFWLRLHLKVDSSLNQQMVMMILQVGASEIYLNGKLIQRFGVLSTNLGEIKAFNPFYKPVSLPLLSASAQVLAVRYAYESHISYSSSFGYINKCIEINVNSIENGNEKFAAHTSLGTRITFHIAVFFTLWLLFFTFYLFYPTRKINLYFSLYSLSQIVYEFIYFYRLDQNQVEWLFLLGIIAILLQVFGYLLLLWAIYNLLEQKIGVFFWIVLLLGFISILMDTFVYGWGWWVNVILFINLLMIDAFRVAVKALKNNKKGAWIMVISGIFTMLSWFIAYLQTAIYFGIIHIDFISKIPIDFTGITILCNPIAVAIYLGYDFALTNLSLQQKLVENEKLSVEKQQILSTQNETLEKKVIERTAELKASQAQLIQKEKLASLGELTAGIAHEIQNPLNFVNNFSEVSIELVEELKSPLTPRGGIEEQELLTDISQNLQKINHHGKRASGIVKGMLEHSRTSKGEKEMTDINELADEYLRLSYHGLRAKNPSFKADYGLIADKNLPKINVIPQEIGRVLLNLINNAFYAAYNSKNPNPKVTVTTKALDNQIEIRVKDNGNGIPETNLEKIFQPFFTTKPTGEGTGLGLSLSYDIITKGHGGTLEVESVEGEGAEFIIILPLKTNGL